MLDILKLTENQSRQYIDAQALMRAHSDALVDAAQVRGSMIWRELRGVRYLIRTSAAARKKPSALTAPTLNRFMPVLWSAKRPPPHV